MSKTYLPSSNHSHLDDHPAPFLPYAKAFFINTLKLLKPGGLSVHTTELMLSDLEEVTSGHTSIWRYKDVEEVHNNASKLGFEVFPIDVRVGEHQVRGCVPKYLW